MQPLWFFAKQAGDTQELESLKKRAFANEKALRKIRRRYTKELSKSGWFRLLRRSLWDSPSRVEDNQFSHSSSSDSSALSASTLESLVQGRIRAEGRRESAFSPREGDDDERDFFEGERTEGSGGFEEKEGEGETSNSEMSESFGDDAFKENRVQLDSDEDAGAAGAGVSMQLPGNPSEGSKLSYKFNQLSQRKIGTLRRLLEQNERQDKQADDERAVSPTHFLKICTFAFTGV
ncbi:hypothetical protein Esti_005262 [Eimeria stiedai]